MMNRSGAWYQPQTAHAAKQWVAMANMATPCSLTPFIFLLFLSWFSHFFLFLCLSLPLSLHLAFHLSLPSVSSPHCLVFRPPRLCWSDSFPSLWYFLTHRCPSFLLSKHRGQTPKKESLEVQYTEGQLRWLVQALDSLMIVCLLLFDNFSKSAVHVDWLRTERTIRQMSASNDKEC